MSTDKGMLGRYAGLVTRAGALLLDLAIVALIIFVIYWTLALPLQFFLGFDPSECVAGQSSIPRIYCRIIGLTWTIVTLSTPPIYAVLFIATTGQTIGAAVMGVRVVRLDGKRMTLRHAIVRYVGMILSALPLGAGYFWTLLDDRRQTWHDRMAGTVVVYAWRASQNEFLLARVQRFVDKRTGVVPAEKPVMLVDHVGHDLVTVAFESYRQLRQMLNRIQETAGQDELEIATLTIFVVDEKGNLGVVGTADVSSGEQIMHVEPDAVTIPRRLLRQIALDTPRDRFLIAVILPEHATDRLIKIITRSTPALVRRYELDDEPPARPHQLAAKSGASAVRPTGAPRRELPDSQATRGPSTAPSTGPSSDDEPPESVTPLDLAGEAESWIHREPDRPAPPANAINRNGLHK
ncbi:MAG: RDD family protein [Caldilineaceae bacterium]|nr:RDD family protein [Caldilineaceae bacterium]